MQSAQIEQASVGSFPHSPSLRKVDLLSDISEILLESVNMVFYQRALSEPIQAFVSQPWSRSVLERRLMVELKDTASLHGIEEMLQECRDLFGYREFFNDLRDWVGILQDLTGSQTFGLRLKTLNKAMCPKFHSDFVRLRWLCTYCGPGTEVVDEGWIQRDPLQGATSNGLKGQFPYHEYSTQAEAGVVVLLKGETWPNNHGRGAVHRSPDVETDCCDSSHNRVLVSIDCLD